MHPVILLLATAVVPVIAVVTSGLYSISSNYYLSDVISQTGGDIVLQPIIAGRLEQIWSLVITNKTITIQNVGTKAFFSLNANGTVVPNVKPYNWTITPDTPAGAGIVSNGKAVYSEFELSPLAVYAESNVNSSLWNFIPALPPPHAYRIWNQATNLYIDEQLGGPGCDDFPFRCVLASAYNVSSKSQVWHVAGPTSCGGRPILQNAASKAFLASGPDFTVAGSQTYMSSEAFPWAYGFVGGQLTLHATDPIFNPTTVTVFEGLWVDMYASSAGPGSAPEQLWVFLPA